MNCKIFISYRREDTQMEAEWLYNELCRDEKFKSILFRDTESIRTGDVWNEVIEKRLGESEIVLVLIGPNWLARNKTTPGNDLISKTDWVLKEIETARNHMKKIIPVFVNGTPPLDETILPDTIKFITTIQNCSLYTKETDTNGLKNITDFLKEELDNSSYLQKRLTTKFEGRYEIRNKIGKSVMTQVFIARDLALDREVAIKAITDPIYKPDFSRTVRDALKITEYIPNSIQILEASLNDDLAHVVTPFLSNGSLRKKIFENRGKGLPLIKCHRYLLDIGEALVNAHLAGFTHLNVKPSNVILGSNIPYLSSLNRLKHLTIDYVIKKFAPDNRDPNELTYQEDLCYMAPEIFEINQFGLTDDAMDLQVDQYMLGLLGYELLAGRLPATIRCDLLQKEGMITFNKLVKVNTIRKDCPVQLAGIIQKMTSLDPRERYPGLKEAVEAIRQINFGDIEIAKESYARCISGNDQNNKFFQVFYGELIRISPKAAEKFKDSFSSAEKKQKQYEMLKQAIFILLLFAEKNIPDEGPNVLTRIAISHKRAPLDITPEMYDDFCLALTNTVCGAPPDVPRGFDKYCRLNKNESKRIKQAWVRALEPGLRYMKQAYADRAT